MRLGLANETDRGHGRTLWRWLIGQSVDPPSVLWDLPLGIWYCWQCEQWYHDLFRPHPGYYAWDIQHGRVMTLLLKRFGRQSYITREEM